MPNNKTLEFSCNIIAEDIESHLSLAELERIKDSKGIHKSFETKALLVCTENSTCKVHIEFDNDTSTTNPPTKSENNKECNTAQNIIISGVISALIGACATEFIKRCCTMCAYKKVTKWANKLRSRNQQSVQDNGDSTQSSGSANGEFFSCDENQADDPTASGYNSPSANGDI